MMWMLAQSPMASSVRLTRLRNARLVPLTDTAKIGPRRNLTMPGLSATVGEQIAALRRVAGDKVADRIKGEPDPFIVGIVAGWPHRFEARRALAELRDALQRVARAGGVVAIRGVRLGKGHGAEYVDVTVEHLSEPEASGSMPKGETRRRPLGRHLVHDAAEDLPRQRLERLVLEPQHPPPLIVSANGAKEGHDRAVLGLRAGVALRHETYQLGDVDLSGPDADGIHPSSIASALTRPSAHRRPLASRRWSGFKAG